MTHLTGSRRQGMCRCRHHGGHHERHELLQQLLLTAVCKELASLSNYKIYTARISISRAPTTLRNHCTVSGVKTVNRMSKLLICGVPPTWHSFASVCLAFLFLAARPDRTKKIVYFSHLSLSIPCETAYKRSLEDYRKY